MSASIGTTEILRPERFGYLSVQVPDVQKTLDLFVRYFQLEPDKLPDGRVCVRGQTDSHWVVLEEGPRKRLTRLAFEVNDSDEIDLYAKRLSDRGVPVEQGFDKQARIGRFVRFNDPDGNPIEFFFGMTQFATPAPRRAIHSTHLLHTVLLVPDVERSYEFYSDVLGFRASDWVEDSAVFMHIGNGFHHSLALMRATSEEGLDHICFLMEDMDDVMRLRAKAINNGIGSRSDVKKHAPSGSISYYINDTSSGLVLEACWGHAQIESTSLHRPRVLPKRPETGNLWLASDDGPSSAVMDGPLGSS